MTPIAIAPRTTIPLSRATGGARELLGVKPSAARPSFDDYRRPTTSEAFADAESPIEATADVVTPALPAPKAVASELEKAVRRMPTLYVIAFFGVVVACAVLIIWNTLQVNRLTAERTKLDDKIEQTQQRLIRLRAEEMQLSAPSRVGQIARTKLGMVEAMSEDIVVVK